MCQHDGVHWLHYLYTVKEGQRMQVFMLMVWKDAEIVWLKLNTAHGHHGLLAYSSLRADIKAWLGSSPRTYASCHPTTKPGKVPNQRI